MEKSSATILYFPSGKPTQSSETTGPQACAHERIEQAALDLAIITDELSMRISGNNNKVVTRLAIQRYRQDLVIARAMLSKLENALCEVYPDSV